MPVHVEDLKPEEQVHIAVKHNTTWAMAAAALKQRFGNPSWPLVVKKSDGSYAAARYQTILEAGEVSPETEVEKLPGLMPIETVEMRSIGTGAAWDKVNSSNAKLIVLTDQTKFAGVMVKGANRSGGSLPSGKLDRLAGSNVDLSKLGDFLLDEA